MELYDIAVIGGGINGAGIARDAAGRGLKVLLAEQNDFASATSSASTKLIHGGLRYLEYYEFRLVSEALAEREVMLNIAPHIIWPLEFVLPHEKHLRPAWMIRTGLFLYDNLGTRAFALGGGRTSLPRSRSVKLAPEGHGAGLKPEFHRGFAYYDAWVDDARLVVLTLASARAHGASVRARTRCTGARREGDAWQVTLRDEASGKESEIRARILVNAAGPWVKSLLERELRIESPGQVRLVKGSHIVVPRIHDRRYAYILQNPDRRVVFMIPYEREFTLIGTTDVPVTPQDLPAAISPDEVAYLCAAASRYSARKVTPDQVVWSYSGVRPLYDDGKADPSAITRDYVLLLDESGPPLLSVFGGKITTYRKLAEQVMQKLAHWIPAHRSWTHTEALPGGDFGGRDYAAVLAEFRARYPGLDPHWLARLLRRHGTLSEKILAGAKCEADLGENFGGGLYERELAYLAEYEWARSGDDVLWRRTKCGLHMSEAQRTRVAERLAGAR
ncbi:MAG: glycerol-3-phosphate dehydrogenase [Burkholderiales bacterium]|jgi:glycerol-3-phosphate dehydrogenase